jgi:hypothetical protein
MKRWAVKLPLLLAIYHFVLIWCLSFVKQNPRAEPPIFFMLGELPIMVPTYLLGSHIANVIHFIFGVSAEVAIGLVPAIFWITYGLFFGNLMDKHKREALEASK